jgi:hypothetical protein
MRAGAADALSHLEYRFQWPDLHNAVCHSTRSLRDLLDSVFDIRRFDQRETRDWQVGAHERAAAALHASPGWITHLHRAAQDADDRS